MGRERIRNSELRQWEFFALFALIKREFGDTDAQTSAQSYKCLGIVIKLRRQLNLSASDSPLTKTRAI